MGRHDTTVTCNQIFEFREFLLGSLVSLETRQENWVNYRTTGPNFPDWKDRIANLKEATTSLTAFRKECKGFRSGTASFNLGTTPNAQQYTGAIALARSDLYPLHAEAFDDGLYIKALGRAEEDFASKYRERSREFQSGVFIGELAETVRFLKNPAKSLEKLTTGKLADGMKAANRKTRGATNSQKLQAVTDTWLAYVYAAKPLVSDISDAHIALSHQYGFDADGLTVSSGAFVLDLQHEHNREAQGWRNGIRVRGVGASESVSDQRLEVVKGDVRAWFYSKQSCSIIIRGAVAYGMDGRPSPYQRWGLTPDNWAPTLWEIIPYSFVVDYFTNVGSVIDAWSVGFVDFAWVNMTIRQESTRECRGLTKDPNDTNPQNFAAGGHGVITQKQVARRVHSNEFNPRFSLKLPSTGQALNLAALANTVQSLKKLKW
jgi:hypothetical protein